MVAHTSWLSHTAVTLRGDLNVSEEITWKILSLSQRQQRVSSGKLKTGFLPSSLSSPATPTMDTLTSQSNVPRSRHYASLSLNFTA